LLQPLLRPAGTGILFQTLPVITGDVISFQLK
jgi:hypothetical protein